MKTTMKLKVSFNLLMLIFVVLDQEPLKRLPITQDLKFIQYTGFTDDGEDQVLGFAFLYED